MTDFLQMRGNSIYILIREYMKKNISNKKFIIILLFQGLLQKHNITLLNHPYDKFYYENYVLDELEYYIKEIKYNKNIIKDISANILPKFIENDNKRIRKLLRKLLIIKERNEQKEMMHNFHKWLNNIYISNFCDNNKKSRNIETKIKKEDKKDNFLHKSENILKINGYTDKIINNKNRMNKALNLKLTNKKYINKTSSFLSKANKNKKTQTNSLISNRSFSPNNKNIKSQSSSIQINKNKKRKMNSNNNNKSCSISKKNNQIILSETTSRNLKAKTPNKHNDMIKNFMNNLIINKKNKEEKIKLLNNKQEEKINSIYTFSPKIIKNKNNEKYLKNMIDKLIINNVKENCKNNISNEDYINKSNNYENQLDVVMEEGRKNINFINRLDEYEKRRINNLEKIKTDILIDEYLNNDMNKYNSINDKYNINDDHLLSVSNSYFINKKNLINKLIKNIDEEKGITFEPKLNKEYNDKIKNNFNNLKEVLLNKRKEKIYDYLSSKDKECTFQPRINFSDNTSIINNRTNIGDRLLAYQDKYNQKLIELKNKRPKYSFKPKLSKNSYNILKKKRIINNLKEQINVNISAKSNKNNFEEEKYSLKINEEKNKLENKEANFTPIFEYSMKENNNNNNNNNNLSEFNFDKSSECSDIEFKNILNRNFISSLVHRRNNSNNKKVQNIYKNKNLMDFDYYDNLI